MQKMAEEGLLNIAGGCCGTTPEFIKLLSQTMKDYKARAIPKLKPALRLAGLEPVTFDGESRFSVIGERTNVTGSPVFRTAVKEVGLG